MDLRELKSNVKKVIYGTNSFIYDTTYVDGVYSVIIKLDPYIESSNNDLDLYISVYWIDSAECYEIINTSDIKTKHIGTRCHDLNRFFNDMYKKGFDAMFKNLYYN